MANGAIPKCDKCGGGNLNLNDACDTVSCSGYMDDTTVILIFIPILFHFVQY